MGCLSTILTVLLVLFVIALAVYAFAAVAIIAAVVLVIYIIYRVAKAIRQNNAKKRAMNSLYPKDKVDGYSGYKQKTLSDLSTENKKEHLDVIKTRKADFSYIQTADYGNCLYQDLTTIVKTSIDRRCKLDGDIKTLKKALKKHNGFRKESSDESEANELETILYDLENQFAMCIYELHDESTLEFDQFRSAWANFVSQTSVVRHDGTKIDPAYLVCKKPANNTINMNGFAPVYIKNGNNTLCMTPHYIIGYKNDKFMGIYSTRLIKASSTLGTYYETVQHKAYAHTRVDGLPDRRYKNNPIITTFVKEARHCEVLILSIGGTEFRYRNVSQLDELVRVINNYSSVQRPNVHETISVKPEKQLIDLLKFCDNCNGDIEEMYRSINPMHDVDLDYVMQKYGKYYYRR